MTGVEQRRSGRNGKVTSATFLFVHDGRTRCGHLISRSPPMTAPAGAVLRRDRRAP